MTRLQRADSQPSGDAEADEVREEQTEVHEQDENIEGADDLGRIGDGDSRRLRHGLPDEKRDAQSDADERVQKPQHAEQSADDDEPKGPATPSG